MNSVVLTILMVAFVIVSVLLVLLVLVQDQESSGMGGLLGGGTSQAFGSHSASVLTKATVVFVVLFFVATFVIAKAYSTKTAGDAKAMSEAAAELQTERPAAESSESESASDSNEKWWKKSETVNEPAAESAENIDSAEASVPEAGN